MIIAVYGLPGTGKSTFAKDLAKKLNAYHLDSDVVRKNAGLAGKYDLESKFKVYHEMANEMAEIILSGKSVIIDSTLFLEDSRQVFIDKADEIGATIFFIEVKAGESTIKQRIKNSHRETGADYDVYKKIKSEFEPFNYSHLIMYSDILDQIEMQKYTLGYLKN